MYKADTIDGDTLTLARFDLAGPNFVASTNGSCDGLARIINHTSTLSKNTVFPKHSMQDQLDFLNDHLKGKFAIVTLSPKGLVAKGIADSFDDLADVSTDDCSVLVKCMTIEKGILRFVSFPEADVEEVTIPTERGVTMWLDISMFDCIEVIDPSEAEEDDDEDDDYFDESSEPAVL